MPSTVLLAGFTASSIGEATMDAFAAAKAGLGARVDRTTNDLPASTTGAIFTVTGYVMITSFLGLVTTVIQAQACNYSLEFDPTVTGSNVALCGVLDINAKAVGTLFSLVGVLATAMSSGLAVIGQTTPLLLQPGAIVQKTAATNTGQVQWSCWYRPMSAGALVVAA